MFGREGNAFGIDLMNVDEMSGHELHPDQAEYV